MKLVPISAAVLAGALTLVATASAQVLPAPPAANGPAASAIFDAMLAIARAAASNPAAARTATFSYDAAIQQFNARDFTRAQMSALNAISQTAAVPLPQPSLTTPPIPQPSYYRMPNVTSADQADAESYIGVARRALTACGEPGATPPAAIMQQYTAAASALVAKKNGAAKASAQYVIDQCAAATTAFAAQAAAKPQPSLTPIPLGSYSPVPLATLIPDPALRGTTH